ncbi:MAG: hypothetical protein A2W35_11335 [Chloroflexi bacterium RBG_16_57_11]|nr:MAG: hypothetical protein A2W35_11335 [Chloroflexi bacterium RBG_16_57_11]
MSANPDEEDADEQEWVGADVKADPGEEELKDVDEDEDEDVNEDIGENEVNDDDDDEGISSDAKSRVARGAPLSVVEETMLCIDSSGAFQQAADRSIEFNVVGRSTRRFISAFTITRA